MSEIQMKMDNGYVDEEKDGNEMQRIERQCTGNAIRREIDRETGGEIEIKISVHSIVVQNEEPKCRVHSACTYTVAMR